MPSRLVPLNPHQGPVISLTRPIFLVGRHPECDIRIDLPQISRRHCCLAMAQDQIIIRDLGSRHGVWLNGRQIQESRLRPGDEIAIGHLLYRLEQPQVQPGAERSGATPEPVSVSQPSEPAKLDNPLPSLGLDLGETFSLRD